MDDHAISNFASHFGHLGTDGRQYDFRRTVILIFRSKRRGHKRMPVVFADEF